MADIPYCLPEYLVVPARVAGRIRIIGENLSHRDLAYAVSAVWLAANTECRVMPSRPTPDVPGKPHLFRIPDNGLRHAMGQKRRESIDKDDERMKRLDRTTFGSMKAPVAPSRHNLDDARTWFIDPELVKEWTVIEGEPVVYVPLILLQMAKSRYSLEAFLHAMALAAGIEPYGGKIIRKEDDRVTVQLDEGGFRRFMTANSSHSNFRIRTDVLAEIMKDLPGWGEVLIDPVVRTSSSERFPKGRFMSCRLHVVHPPLAEIEARAASSATWLAPRRTSVPGWENKPSLPRSTRAPARTPAPAFIDNVEYVPEPERPVIPRGSTPRVPDDEDIEF